LNIDCDKLYQKENIPWEQDGNGKRLKNYYQQSRDKLYILINKFGTNISEVGCGLGYCLNYLTNHKEGKFTGYDISPTAIKKASGLFPTLNFKVLDIRKEVVKDQMIILNELLWYVIKDLDKVLDNCKCKYLVINQSFLPVQKFDKDLINGFNGLVKYVLSKDYTIIHSDYDYLGKPLMNGVILCIKQNI